MRRPNVATESLNDFSAGVLLNKLCERIATRIPDSGDIPESTCDWAVGLPVLLDGRPFSLDGHEYQRDILDCAAPRQVFKKGAQLGLTSVLMIKTIHGMLRGRYPAGCLCLFPSGSDVTDFSKGRFGPLINDNPSIAAKVERPDGSKVYTYLKLGADHYRHAYNYEALARRFGASSYFGDCPV